MALSRIKGGKVDVRIWAPINEVESQALTQLRNIASLPWVFHHVAAMADCHLGKGATVGSVIAMKNAVAPAAVGVDIGCVDKDTEYLSPEGWKKISDYDGGQVMQYDPETEVGTFVEPEAFIKLPCDKFLRIKTKYGVNQMLSVEHKVLYAKYDRAYKFDKLDTIQAGDLAGHHNSTSQGFRGRFLTTFKPEINTSVEFTDAQLRVAVMVAADGSFGSSSKTSTRCYLRLKKTRKIDRARLLLNEAQIEFTEHAHEGEITEIRFYAPVRLKSLGAFWAASIHQLQLIADEVIQWDGNKDNRCFYTRDKASADFIHYVFAALEFRSVMRADIDKSDGKTDYRVFYHYNTKVGINGSKKSPIEFVPSEDGFKYCFTLPTGFWVMRRGGNIAITGNCGMAAVKTSLTASDLPDNLKPLRLAIESVIPVGFNWHKSGFVKGVQTLPMWQNFKNLSPKVQKLQGRAMMQCGTLGGGNHFIEVCLDTDQNVWLMLHSGSRNIGKSIADVHISKAKKLAHNQELPDRDLSVFLAGTKEMKEYRHDLYWAQNYALQNRRVMMKLLKKQIIKFFPKVTFEKAVECHHNYVAEEVHYGEEVFVTRKGAIRAGVGELGIIPGSMGTKSYIVEGLGSAESFESASHGAGRRMSRGAARRQFTEADILKQTEGVECRKDKGIVDEIPASYKDIEQVMQNQQDLVSVVAEIKQILCVKG